MSKKSARKPWLGGTWRFFHGFSTPSRQPVDSPPDGLGDPSHWAGHWGESLVTAICDSHRGERSSRGSAFPPFTIESLRRTTVFPTNHDSSMTIIEKLRAIAENTQLDHSAKALALQYLESVEQPTRLLESPDYTVALVGQKGVGKSALLAVVSGLIIGDRPRNADDMDERCVPAVGAGETTLCEVRVKPTTAADCPAPDGMHFGIVIEPRTLDDVEREIGIFAEIEVQRLRPNSACVTGSQELQDREIARAIRGMTGTTQIKMRDAAGRFQGFDDPIEKLALDANYEERKLANTLCERAKLDSRTAIKWWFDGPREKALNDVKDLFFKLNNGQQPDATLPRRITIWSTAADHFVLDGREISFVDTRGFDGNLHARGDLQAVMQDEHTLILLCLHFTDHANESIRELLLDCTQHLSFLNVSSDRVRMVIVDKDASRFTAGAGGESEVGQFLKKEACINTLIAHQLGSFAQGDNSTERVVVFDTTRDNIQKLTRLINDAFDGMRTRAQQSLEAAESQAREFLDSVHDKAQTQTRREVDQRLSQMFMAAKPEHAFLPECIDGLAKLVNGNRRFASRVWAMCRRNGEYDNMNAYDAVCSYVQEAFDKHCTGLDAVMRAQFAALENDGAFATVLGHIHERRDAYERRKSKLRTEFAIHIREAVRNAMRPDRVWTQAANRWGQGPGFLDDVIGYFKNWSDDNKAAIPVRQSFRPQDFGLTEASPA